MLVIRDLVPSMLHPTHYTAKGRTLRALIGSGAPICRGYVPFGRPRAAGSADLERHEVAAQRVGLEDLLLGVARPVDGADASGPGARAEAAGAAEGPARRAPCLHVCRAAAADNPAEAAGGLEVAAEARSAA